MVFRLMLCEILTKIETILWCESRAYVVDTLSTFQHAAANTSLSFIIFLKKTLYIPYKILVASNTVPVGRYLQ